MGQPNTQTDGHRINGSFAVIQRLRRENARLGAACAHNQELAAHYQLLRRESDHRIKNSLQIVAGMLQQQARRSTDLGAREALNAAAARIQAVGHVHDALQLGKGTAGVDLGALIGVMSKSLNAIAGEAGAIRIVANTTPIPVPVEFAQPILLVVNELVINALRHAFPRGRKGAVLVEASICAEDVRISVADDGVGVPEEGANAGGYGTRLIAAMTRALGARLEVQRLSGTRVTLWAPLRRTAETAPTRCVAETC